MIALYLGEKVAGACIRWKLGGSCFITEGVG